MKQLEIEAFEANEIILDSILLCMVISVPLIGILLGIFKFLNTKAWFTKCVSSLTLIARKKSRASISFLFGGAKVVKEKDLEIEARFFFFFVECVNVYF